MDRIEAPQPELIVPNFPRTAEGGTPERIRTPTTVVRGHVHSSIMLQTHIIPVSKPFICRGTDETGKQ